MRRLIWECAGTLGTHPGPFTLFELLEMRRGRLRDYWDGVATIANRLFSKTPVRNPFLPQKVVPFSNDGLAALRDRYSSASKSRSGNEEVNDARNHESEKE
ncbi:MAG: hypothetical protein Q4D38_13945 [Planctomycetia bacterium]|nr:hypothetical protein [Planctomycetia bacterium]